MKFKIPEINKGPINKHKAEEYAALDNADDTLNELEHTDPDNYAEQHVQSVVSQEAPVFTVGEGQLRKIWAGEIAFGLLAAFAAVIIAFVG